MTVDLDLLADLVADRVVERLLAVDGRGASSAGRAVGGAPRVFTAREVAEMLGRSTDWVRQHRAELGLVPGVGARPRLLFDADAVAAWVAGSVSARGEVVQSQGPDAASPLVAARRRRASSGSGVDLLPIAGDRRAA